MPPEVSVVVPCLNEEAHIAACLESLLDGGFPPERMEVLVVDGRSADRTREVVASFSARRPQVRLLDNPGRTAPCALNIGVRACAGDFILRADAHSIYPPGYIQGCLDLLKSTGAGNAGGRIVTVPNGTGPWSAPVARVTSHRFGVGGGAFRVSEEPGFVDTVPFGAFPRRVFDEVGLFDERLTRNQDNEFNARLRRAGYKIAFDPRIRVAYKNQATLSGLCRQGFFTGMWNMYTLRLHPHSFQRRRFVPAAFVLYLAALPPGLGFLGPAAALPLAAYAALCLRAAFDPARPAAENARTALTFAAYHASYGSGAWFGLLNLATGRWTAYLGRVLKS